MVASSNHRCHKRRPGKQEVGSSPLRACHPFCACRPRRAGCCGKACVKVTGPLAVGTPQQQAHGAPYLESQWQQQQQAPQQQQPWGGYAQLYQGQQASRFLLHVLLWQMWQSDWQLNFRPLCKSVQALPLLPPFPRLFASRCLQTPTGFAQQPYQQMYQQLPPQQLPPQQQQAGWNPYAQYQQNYAYPGQQPQVRGSSMPLVCAAPSCSVAQS